MNIADLKGQKILLAASGGLDSCTITHWLQSQGLEVVAYTADLGQPDEERIEDIRSRMQACGATEMILDDRREAICQAGIQLVQSQARYEGGYWNTTGIARHVTVARYVAPYAGARHPSDGARGHRARQRPSPLPTGGADARVRTSRCTLPGATRRSCKTSVGAAK